MHSLLQVLLQFLWHLDLRTSLKFTQGTQDQHKAWQQAENYGYETFVVQAVGTGAPTGQAAEILWFL